MLFSTALRICGGWADAEDLTATAFLRAFRALSGYDRERIAASGRAALGTGWRSIFWVNVPVGVVALAGAAVLLPRESRGHARLDLPGVGLLTAAMACLSPAGVRPRAGLARLDLGCLGASVIAFAGFTGFERRRAARGGEGSRGRPARSCPPAAAPPRSRPCVTRSGYRPAPASAHHDRGQFLGISTGFWP